jgi:hypothetical protein
VRQVDGEERVGDELQLELPARTPGKGFVLLAERRKRKRERGWMFF